MKVTGILVAVAILLGTTAATASECITTQYGRACVIVLGQKYTLDSLDYGKCVPGKFSAIGTLNYVKCESVFGKLTFEHERNTTGPNPHPLTGVSTRK